MKLKRLILIPLLSISLFGCNTDFGTSFKVLDLKIQDDEISEAMKQFANENRFGYPDDTLFDVTPSRIKGSYRIYKYQYSTASFLEYKDKIYPLGEFFGGHGVTQLAEYEHEETSLLYYIYSFGSGRHRTQIGAFDFKELKCKSVNCELKEDVVSKDLVFGGSDKVFGGISIDLYTTDYEWAEDQLTFNFKYGEKVFEGIENCILVDLKSN